MKRKNIFRREAIETYVRDIAGSDSPLSEVIPKLYLGWAAVAVLFIVVGVIWSFPGQISLPCRISSISQVDDRLAAPVIEVDMPAESRSTVITGNQHSLCVPAACQPVQLISVRDTAGSRPRLVRVVLASQRSLTAGGLSQGEDVVLTLHCSILQRIGDMIHSK